jgi:hypothetical protein
MKQRIQLEIDLTFNEGGGFRAKLVSSKRLGEHRSGVCFLTGELKATCQCVECEPSLSAQARGPKDPVELEVLFTHPREAKFFTAFVSPNCTGERALKGLIAGDDEGPFLEPAPPGFPYELAIMQSGVAITPNMTFAEAGVVNGDKIEVRQAGQGAGIPWDAIQLSFAYGVGTGAGLAIIKALGPIIQQIVKNRGTRSIELEVAGKRIKLVGKNSISEAMAAISELAQTYGYDESAGSNQSRGTASEMEVRTSASKKTSRVGKLAKTGKAPKKDLPRRTRNRRTSKITRS